MSQQPSERRSVRGQESRRLDIDRAIPFQHGRFVTMAEQSQHRDGDVHGRSDPPQDRHIRFTAAGVRTGRWFGDGAVGRVPLQERRAEHVRHELGHGARASPLARRLIAASVTRW